MDDQTTLYEERKVQLYLHYEVMCESAIVKYICARSYATAKFAMLRSKEKLNFEMNMEACYDSREIMHHSYMKMSELVDHYHRRIDELEQAACGELGAIERNFLDNLRKLPRSPHDENERAPHSVRELIEVIEERLTGILSRYCSIVEKVRIHRWLHGVEDLTIGHVVP